MRKIIAAVIVILLLSTSVVSADGTGDYKGLPVVKVKLNGKDIVSEVPALIVDGTTLLPVRSLSESLGLGVAWNSDTSTVSLTSKENWPNVEQKPEYKDMVAAAQEKYAEYKYDYKNYVQDYKFTGDYLNSSQMVKYRVSDTVKFDDKGIPLVKHGEEFYYNPVTVEQFALSAYGKYLNGNAAMKDTFISAVDKLLTMQREDGAFPYPFDFDYYVTNSTIPAGWVSSMAQGQALSALVRAYEITKDDKYIKAGENAFRFMIKPVSQGGTLDTLSNLDPSLGKYLIFEEYPANKSSYTLNGFMFTLLGIYDWSAMFPDTIVGKQAKEYFDKGIETLTKILPYYDIGGMTVYDLGYITYGNKPAVNVGYHRVHLYLLNVLHQVTNNNTLGYFERVWASYVNN